MTEISNSDVLMEYDMHDFYRYICPFGSDDVLHLLKKGRELKIRPDEMVDTLYNIADILGIDLLNEECITDINALFNNYYLLPKVRIDVLNASNNSIDLHNYDTYYFQNYLDDPLRYDTRLANDINRLYEEGKFKIENLDRVDVYLLLDIYGLEKELINKMNQIYKEG